MVLQNVVGTHNKHTHIVTYCMYMVIEHKNHNHHQKRAAQYREYKMWNFFGWKRSVKKGIVKNDFLIAFSTTRCFICLSIYPQCIKIFFCFLVICKEKLFFFIVQCFYWFLCFCLFQFHFMPILSPSIYYCIFLQTVADKQIDFQLFLPSFCFCFFYHWIKFYLFPSITEIDH